jgi:hypothetical protein
MFSCKQRINNKQLSNTTINNFNEIMKNYSLNDHKYIFNKGFYIYDVFEYADTNFMSKKDTVNFSFFKLVEDTLSVFVAINRELCYLSILSNLNNKYFLNNSLILPGNFSFLNNEKLPAKFDCINTDSIEFREVGYDANLIGEWSLDSSVVFRVNRDLIKEIKKEINVLNDSVILIDNYRYEYEHDGYILKVLKSPYLLYKIFLNDRKMILINIFKNSYIEYYFTKNSTRSLTKKLINCRDMIINQLSCG